MILLLHFCLTEQLPFHGVGNTSLIPQWDYLTEFKTANKKFKDQQKKNLDNSHRVCNLPDIPDNTDVWITTDGQNTPGTTVRRAEVPRTHQQEKCIEIEVNLMSTCPQQQTVNQLQIAVVLS